jgi:hypothetical protein
MKARHLLLFCLSGAMLSAADYRLSGPYSQDQATIYLVHPVKAATADGRKYLPLKEALAQSKVRVLETGNVNQLTIENLSADTDVFIQSGDIVKGGQQDRVFATDLILPPKSGKTRIESFCVEQGRWSRRGNEDVKSFSASTNSIVSKDAKLAIKGSKNQGDVWKSVARVQSNLGGVIGGIIGGVGAGVAAPASPTSLQLSLENKQVNLTSERQAAFLRGLLLGKADAVGYVFAVNGEIHSADVYGSAALFQELWAKQAQALAVEAIAEKTKPGAAKVSTEAALGFLTKAELASVPVAEAPANARTRVIKRDSAKVLFVESHDTASKRWIHRSYTAK